jgi:acyl carrier protein
MNRQDIQQHVFDTIGIILVDKSEIHEDSSFRDLRLDEDDVNELFTQLQNDYGFEFPAAVKTRAVEKPEELILPMLVDLILMLRKDQPRRSNKGSTSENKD